jgi:hypothetical protein
VRLPGVLAGFAAVLFGVFEGFIGFTFVTPGASLATICALLVAIGVLALALAWAALRKLGTRVPLAVFAAGTVLLGAAAIWWTWAFAMPAALQWDAGATPRALAALQGIGNEKSVCVNVTSGAIGPLTPPFRQCAINGAPGSTVEYTALSGTTPASPYRGLLFSFAPEATFSDECSRHLVGHWYASTSDPSGLIGYTCHGGG